MERAAAVPRGRSRRAEYFGHHAAALERVHAGGHGPPAHAEPGILSGNLPGAGTCAQHDPGFLLDSRSRQIGAGARRALSRLPALSPRRPRARAESAEARRQPAGLRLERRRGRAVRRQLAALGRQCQQGAARRPDRRRAPAYAFVRRSLQSLHHRRGGSPHLRPFGRAQGGGIRQRAQRAASRRRRLTRRTALSSVVEKPIEALPLPLTLHAYRPLLNLATPLAALLLSHRLTRGKEDAERLPERRGETTVARPEGPLVWLHGASVGEVAAIIPLVERIVSKEFKVLVTSRTLASAALCKQRLPAAGRHQVVPAAAARF